MSSLSDSSRAVRSSFQQVAACFLSQPGLPFASVLSAERIERIFAKHGNLFGGGAIYSTAIMVWAFLSQVLRDGKEASCQASVARVVALRQQLGQSTPTEDTGDYCRARAKLSEAALRDLTGEVAAQLQEQADPKWLWKGMHAKLVDGFTFTMPDTPQNQAAYPQQKAQKPGVGLPIARAAAIISLATACVMDLAIGPYSGKQTGETALLRALLGSFCSGDLAVMDRYYCSFMMIALLLGRNVQVCARMHQKRHVDFRRGRRLGKYDHLIVWTKPQRPKWMDQAAYDSIPQTLELREIRYRVVEKGYRAQALTVVTTLTDPQAYSKEDIAQLYGFRWNAELDIRSIKQSLNLAHVRCKSPEMVRKELWTTLLGYNLIRTTAAAAALLHGKQPRQISFTSTCQYVLASWMLFSCDLVAADVIEARCREHLAHIANCEVANRPGRIEPRVLKRRRHGYKLMQEPRHVLKKKLMNGNGV
ncbi:MAG: IS4 family transposase [Planctomycetes bacterium]|nr:IS4 family transposase [Planctomycetota bacterium]